MGTGRPLLGFAEKVVLDEMVLDEVKSEIVQHWIRTGHTNLGRIPTVINADGHHSNTTEGLEQVVGAKCLFVIPPAHTTANGTQQLDLPNGLIARFKKILRKLVRKQ